MTEFSIWCLGASLVFNIAGFQSIYFPPKKFRWWGPGVRHHVALRNMDTWTEANKYSAFPSLITGSVFILISFLPELVVPKYIFTQSLATILIVFACLVLNLLIHYHLNKIFDKDGNRK